MAQAKAGPRQTTRRVTLKLTEGEADLLVGLLANVSGNRTQSPRKYAERVRVALEEALGYTFEETDAFRLSLGDVEFRQYDEPDVTAGDRIMNFIGGMGTGEVRVLQ